MRGRCEGSGRKEPPVKSVISTADKASAIKTFSGRKIIAELAGLVLSVFLFYLSFPNDLFHGGIGVLGFVALLPLMLVVNTAPFWRVLLYGSLTGFASYATFNIWLMNFHPLAIFIVPLIYAAYYLILFPLLALPRYAMGKWAWIGQVLIWLGYEYLRTQGFLGYAYGIIGYTQYLNIPLVNFAELTGIWGVSAIVVLPQFFAGWYIPSTFRGNKGGSSGNRGEIADHSGSKFAAVLPQIRGLKGYKTEIAVLAAIVLIGHGLGVFLQVDYSQAPQMNMALVQQNVDPKRGGLRAYRNSMDASIRQSRLALKEAESKQLNLDLIVWSETSFIPAIDFHSRYRLEPEKYELVDELLEFIDSAGVPFLIGNGDGQLALNDEDQYIRKNYNAVYLYSGLEDSTIYRKLHLVPFSEHFPYERQFPWLYELLVKNANEKDNIFWEKGSQWTIFEVGGISFATPVCFEDTFGYLSRGFVGRGADLVVNLTNDSWSESIPAATQHMAMAVFRATENRRTVVRSTNGGMTAVIDPNGRIIDDNTPFTESYVISKVPVYTGKNGIYTAVGDVWAWVFLGAALLCVLWCAVILVFGKKLSWLPAPAFEN